MINVQNMVKLIKHEKLDIHKKCFLISVKMTFIISKSSDDKSGDLLAPQKLSQKVVSITPTLIF